MELKNKIIDKHIQFENWFAKVNKYKWLNFLVMAILIFELIIFRPMKVWVISMDVTLIILNGLVVLVGLFNKMELKHEEPTPEEIYRDYFEYQRKYAIKQIFVKGNMACDLKDDYKLPARYFYLMKALICLLLKRFNLYNYGIMVITYDEYYYPDGNSWEYVSVGEGIFKGWNCQIGTDGV